MSKGRDHAIDLARRGIHRRMRKGRRPTLVDRDAERSMVRVTNIVNEPEKKEKVGFYSRLLGGKM